MGEELSEIEMNANKFVVFQNIHSVGLSVALSVGFNLN